MADEIHARGHVSRNVRDRLEKLNELRKDVQYGEPGPDLAELDLEVVVTELEEFIGEAASFVEA